MSSQKNKVLRAFFTAPIALTLILGASGCTTNTTADHDDEPAVSDKVQQNMESTVSTMVGLSNKEKFVDAVYQFGSDGTKVSGFDEDMDALDDLVANDESMDYVKKSAKDAMVGEDLKLTDENLEILSKSSPLIVLASSYDLESEKTPVEIDPTGFKQTDGGWVQTKDGAIAFKDEHSRYSAFTLTTDGFSFNEDGTKFTLASISKSLKEAEKENTETRQDVNKAIDHLYDWYSKAEDKNSNLDMKKNQDKVLKGFKPKGDTTISLEGNVSEGFVLVAKSKKTGEEITYDSISGEMSSNKDEDSANEEPAQTDALALFDEYLTTYYDSVKEDEEYDSLEDIVKKINKNDTMKKAKWTVEEKDGLKYPVAKMEGKEYGFVTPTEDSDSTVFGNEMSEENGTTQEEFDSEINLDDLELEEPAKKGEEIEVEPAK